MFILTSATVFKNERYTNYIENKYYTENKNETSNRNYTKNRNYTDYKNSTGTICVHLREETDSLLLSLSKEDAMERISHRVDKYIFSSVSSNSYKTKSDLRVTNLIWE